MTSPYITEAMRRCSTSAQIRWVDEWTDDIGTLSAGWFVTWVTDDARKTPMAYDRTADRNTAVRLYLAAINELSKEG